MSYVERQASQDNKFVDSVGTNASVTDKTATYYITEADLGYQFGRGGGKFITNTGAAGAVDLFLPEAPPVGSEIWIVSTAAQTLRIIAQGGDGIQAGASLNQYYTTDKDVGLIRRLIYFGKANDTSVRGYWMQYNKGAGDSSSSSPDW